MTTPTKISTGSDRVSTRTTQRRSGSKPTLLFLVTEDWYFCSHRLPVARAARDAGYDVVVATRVSQHGEAIEREGFRLVPLLWHRGSVNPLRELGALREIISLYRRERPDLVHHVALKPAVYGSIAGRLSGTPPAVNMVAGMGYVFTSRGFKPALIRAFLKAALRRVLRPNNARLVYQNPDDDALLRDLCRPAAGQMILIRGSGVDVERFVPQPEPRQAVVTLVSRMLWNKGIGDLVEASRILRSQGENVRVAVVGAPDPENHSSIPERQLRQWHDEGVIDWLGRREDISDIWANTSVAVLPTTYGEGVPKALLEAAATGRAIVATDVGGCREIVHDGDNGLLVPVNDPPALAAAISRLLHDPELRRAMGMRGRKLVEQEFAEDIVVEQTLSLYRSLVPVHAE